MLLTGRRWDSFTVGEMIDVVEALFAEGGGIDLNLKEVEEQIARLYPDRAQWGLTEAQQASMAAAEQLLLGATSDE